MDALWYNYDLSDAREIIKCIKHIQKVCRDSLEYDEWQRHCKYKDAQDCPICEDNYYEVNAKCESHHHPKTLYDIVEEVLEDHLEKNDLDDFTGYDICTEVMDLHMLKKVSYINLCQHCHKKYHAGHPDVIEKMNVIFAKRAKVGMDDQVVEVDEDLITAGGEVLTQSNIRDTDKSTIVFTDANDAEKDFPKEENVWDIEKHGIKFTVQNAEAPKESPLTMVKNETSGVYPLSLAPKVEKLNIETANNFIAIDINDL